jgi:adhesin transport system membrane fusion protein
MSADAVKADFRGSRPLLWMLVAMVATFIAWAWYSPLDVASYAQGQVTPEGQLKRIQHLEGGIIRELRVQEGQRVRVGDVIAELEDVASTSDVADFRSRMASLELRIIRVNAAIARAESLMLPAEIERDFPSLARETRAAFVAHRDRYRAMVQNHEARIAQRKAEIEEARERLNGLQTRSKLIAEQVQISTAMLKQKLTNEYEHLTLRKEQAHIDADRNATIATLQRANTGLAEANSAFAAFRSEEDVNLRRDMLEATTELNSLSERFKKPSDSRERTTVRAPVAGTIMTVYLRNKGAVLAAGGTIATLVPEGDALLVDARLPIGEVGFVKPGAPARLTMASGTSGFSTIDATVVHISPDAAVDEKTGSPYYVVRLQPGELEFRRGTETYPLRPGVQVMAAIVTGQRSVFDVLVEPFSGSGIRPLTER